MLLNGDRPSRSLVIGIGNPLRSDDGVGSYVAECLEAKGLNGVVVWITQQLNIEDLDKMLGYEKIILVDASVNGSPLDFHVVDKNNGQPIASSHHLSAETFVKLAKSIYQKDLDMYVCMIKGSCFDVGEKLSTEVLKRAQEAVVLISSTLKAN